MTSQDFVVLLPPEPPHEKPLFMMGQEDLELVWRYLQQGVSPTLVTQDLLRKKRFKDARKANDFMSGWLRSVAEEVWESPQRNRWSAGKRN